RYLYESPSFRAELEVDDLALVERYGDVWARVGEAPPAVAHRGDQSGPWAARASATSSAMRSYASTPAGSAPASSSASRASAADGSASAAASASRSAASSRAVRSARATNGGAVTDSVASSTRAPASAPGRWRRSSSHV